MIPEQLMGVACKRIHTRATDYAETARKKAGCKICMK